MERINGFLDLDEYFNNIKREKNLDDTGMNNYGYIINSDYASYQYWLNIDGEYYYFKRTEYGIDEIIVSECANFLDVPAVSYDLAIFYYFKGVISKSYRKNGAHYISGKDILFDYITDKDNLQELEKMGFDRKKLMSMIGTKSSKAEPIHVLEVVWQAIEYRYKNLNIPLNKPIDMEKIMNDIINQFIFNILINQNDGMSQNWELEETKDNVSLAPFYDGELAFQNIESYSFQSLSTNFNDKDKNNYEILEEFLKVSSSEFIDLFLEKFEKFDLASFEGILERVENKIGRKIPFEDKRRIIASFNNNRNNIIAVLEKLNLIKGR